MAHSHLRLTLLASSAVLLGAAPADAADAFARVATMPVFLNLPAGVDPTSETVAEIVAATPDGIPWSIPTARASGSASSTSRTRPRRRLPARSTSAASRPR
jgi:hypothetical protein